MSERLVSNTFFRRLLLLSKELWMRKSKSARSLEQRQTNFESHPIKICVHDLIPQFDLTFCHPLQKIRPKWLWCFVAFGYFWFFFFIQMNFIKYWNTATGRFMILCMSTANSASLARAILSHLGVPPVALLPVRRYIYSPYMYIFTFTYHL